MQMEIKWWYVSKIDLKKKRNFNNSRWLCCLFFDCSLLILLPVVSLLYRCGCEPSWCKKFSKLASLRITNLIFLRFCVGNSPNASTAWNMHCFILVIFFLWNPCNKRRELSCTQSTYWLKQHYNLTTHSLRQHY